MSRQQDVQAGIASVVGNINFLELRPIQHPPLPRLEEEAPPPATDLFSCSTTLRPAPAPPTPPTSSYSSSALHPLHSQGVHHHISGQHLHDGRQHDADTCHLLCPQHDCSAKLTQARDGSRSHTSTRKHGNGSVGLVVCRENFRR